MSYLNKVQAEQFPKTIAFGARDYFALLLIPLIMMNGWIAMQLFDEPMHIALIDSMFRGLLFILLCYLYKGMLLKHWYYFKQQKIQSCLLVFVGAIVLQMIISLTRAFLPLEQTFESNEQHIDPQNVNLFPLLMIALGPIFTALIEDVVFRYTLLHKLFIPHHLFRVLVLGLNSIFFGLIHYFNFDGNLLATVSFMVAGLFLNVVYLYTRNIWHVLLIHVFNNAILSLGAVIVLKLVGA